MDYYKSEEKLSLSDKVDKLTELMESGKGFKKVKKEKPFRMPYSGKLGNAKLKQGYVTVIEIAENSALSFRKEKIVDSTIKLADTYHAIDDSSFLTFKGKPVLIIPKKAINPYNPNKVGNATFGQKHIMSRMMNEVLGIKGKMNALGMSVGALILGGVALYAFIAG